MKVKNITKSRITIINRDTREMVDLMPGEIKDLNIPGIVQRLIEKGRLEKVTDEKPFQPSIQSPIGDGESTGAKRPKRRRKRNWSEFANEADNTQEEEI
jgi:hypothetical protein